jgi:hypothetical protein
MGCDFSKEDIEVNRRSKPLLQATDRGYSAAAISGAASGDAGGGRANDLRDAMSERDRLVKEREREQARLLAICSKNLSACIDVVTSIRYFSAEEAYARSPEYSAAVAGARCDGAPLEALLDKLAEAGRSAQPVDAVEERSMRVAVQAARAALDNTKMPAGGRQAPLVISLEDESLDRAAEGEAL